MKDEHQILRCTAWEKNRSTFESDIKLWEKINQSFAHNNKEQEVGVARMKGQFLLRLWGEMDVENPAACHRGRQIIHCWIAQHRCTTDKC